MQQPEEPASFKYWAFISYSHQDKKWGDWLHKALETYRVPRRLVGQLGRDGAIPKRAYPVFRDREELPGSSDLGNNINEALRNSRYLIVICSPRSAKSQWVNEEIKTFKAMGREDRVLCLIVDGEPNAADKPDICDEECFPPAVKFRINRDGELSDERTEPIAADARPGKDGKANARLKLLAGILGIAYDSLKQRDRRRVMFRRTVGAVLSLLVVGISIFAFNLQRQKEWEKLRAESLHLAEVSIEQTEAGNSEMGILLALEALPEQRTEPNRPYVREAEVALSRAVSSHRQLAVYRDSSALDTVDFTPDGQKFLSVANNSIGVWESETGHKIVDFMDLGAPKARFSPDGSYVMALDWENGQLDLLLLDATTADTLKTKTLGPSRYEVFSPDGRYAVTCCAEDKQSEEGPFAVMFWSTGNDDQRPLILGGLSTAVSKIVFSPRGNRFLLIDSANGYGDVWQLEGGNFTHLQTIQRTITAAAFNSTGEMLAIAPKEGGFEIYTSTGGVISTYEMGQQPLDSLIFTPDDHAIIAHEASWGLSDILDVESGAEIGVFSGKRVVFSPDGTRMAVAARQGHCGLYDLATMQQYAVLVGHEQDINDMVFSPVDSNKLLSASDDHTLRLWRTAFDRKQIFSGHGDKNLHIAYSVDGTKFASISSHGNVRVWENTSGKEVVTLSGSQDTYSEISITFAGDDNTIAASTSRGFGDGPGEKFPLIIRWMNSQTGALLLEQKNQSPWLHQPILNHDRHLALTIGLDHVARILDCRTAQVIHELTGHSENIISASFSPDGTQVLTSSNDGTIRIWNVATGEEIFQVKQINKWGDAAGSFAIFSPDGHTFAATNSQTSFIQIFDCATGKLKQKIESFDSTENRLRFSPDSKYLLSMDEVFATNIHVWDVASGKPVAIFPGSMLSYAKTVFTPDSQLLMSWGNDVQGPIVWSIASGERIVELKLPGNQDNVKGVEDVKISPDGRLIAVSYGEIGGLWDRQTMKLLKYIRGHRSIISIAFNPVENTMLTVGSEGSIQLWETQPDFADLRKKGLSLVSRNLSVEERAKFLASR